MLLTFALDQSAYVQAAGIASTLSGFAVKHSSAPVQLAHQFSNNGVVKDMADPISAIFELKAPGAYDADPEARVTSITKTGSGAAATYTMLLNIDTTAIRTALGIDGETGNDIASITFMGELQVTDATGAQWKSQTLSITIQNDVVKDGDADPVVVAPLKGTVAIPNGASSVAVTGLGLVSTPAVLCSVHKPLAFSRGAFTLGGQPADGNEVVLGATTYVAKSALTGAANEFLIGASVAATQANLKGAINAETTGGQSSGTTYGAGTTANAAASVTSTGASLNATARSPGAPGNAIATSATGAFGAWGGATLSGGADGALNLAATAWNETPDGFSADLTGAADADGYDLNYALFL